MTIIIHSHTQPAGLNGEGQTRGLVVAPPHRSAHAARAHSNPNAERGGAYSASSAIFRNRGRAELGNPVRPQNFSRVYGPGSLIPSSRVHDGNQTTRVFNVLPCEVLFHDGNTTTGRNPRSWKDTTGTRKCQT